MFWLMELEIFTMNQAKFPSEWFQVAVILLFVLFSERFLTGIGAKNNNIKSYTIQNTNKYIFTGMTA